MHPNKGGSLFRLRPGALARACWVTFRRKVSGGHAQPPEQATPASPTPRQLVSMPSPTVTLTFGACPAEATPCGASSPARRLLSAPPPPPPPAINPVEPHKYKSRLQTS